METLLGLTILGTSVWMGIESASFGYDPRDVKGVAGVSPWAWFFGGLLVWVIAFPVYLANRGGLRAAGNPAKKAAMARARAARHQAWVGRTGGYQPKAKGLEFYAGLGLVLALLVGQAMYLMS